MDGKTFHPETTDDQSSVRSRCTPQKANQVSHATSVSPSSRLIDARSRPSQIVQKAVLKAFQKKAETCALSWVTAGIRHFATPISPVHKAGSERDPIHPVYFKANDIPKKDKCCRKPAAAGHYAKRPLTKTFPYKCRATMTKPEDKACYTKCGISPFLRQSQEISDANREDAPRKGKNLLHLAARS